MRGTCDLAEGRYQTETSGERAETSKVMAIVSKICADALRDLTHGFGLEPLYEYAVEEGKHRLDALESRRLRVAKMEAVSQFALASPAVLRLQRRYSP